jgi:hypothetical protein
MKVRIDAEYVFERLHNSSITPNIDAKIVLKESAIVVPHPKLPEMFLFLVSFLSVTELSIKYNTL